MKKLYTKINFDILAFATGITLFMIFAMWFLSCSAPEVDTEPIDYRAYNDSILNAVNDSVDSLPASAKISLEMQQKSIFDTINK